MSDNQITLGDQPKGSKEAPASDWRRILGMVGFVCIMAGVVIGAVSRGGAAAKLLGLGGIVVIAISIAASIINQMSSKLNRGKTAGVDQQS